ncbi:YdcH family protein [Roseateles koreensis]|uniref:YdcH family protein n=1 Tax=Roseateles koreensis TaxID=2987526 RepID=A0ABT5KL56_9BURK|nr:YdcH family protein [Roseateles koreensis]MDC8783648.1 YdcH family protein [Roseateles koreensis]
MDEQLHSLSRRLIELRMEHADLDLMIDRLTLDRERAESLGQPIDELSLRRLKKRRLVLRDLIAKLELENDPDELA